MYLYRYPYRYACSTCCNLLQVPAQVRVLNLLLQYLYRCLRTSCALELKSRRTGTCVRTCTGRSLRTLLSSRARKYLPQALKSTRMRLEVPTSSAQETGRYLRALELKSVLLSACVPTCTGMYLRALERALELQVARKYVPVARKYLPVAQEHADLPVARKYDLKSTQTWDMHADLYRPSTARVCTGLRAPAPDARTYLEHATYLTHVRTCSTQVRTCSSRARRPVQVGTCVLLSSRGYAWALELKSTCTGLERLSSRLLSA